MERLTEALARALGDALALSRPVHALARAGEDWELVAGDGEHLRARRVVLAVPLGAARALLAPAAPAAAEALASMRAESVASVAHAYPRARVRHALDGFGYLAPARDVPVLGTLFSSATSPSAAPLDGVLLRSLIGGARHPGALALGDDALAAHAAADAAALLGIDGAPLWTDVARWPDAIPRLDLEHPARRRRLAAGLPPGLAVLGSFTRGIGLETLVAEARALALAAAA